METRLAEDILHNSYIYVYKTYTNVVKMRSNENPTYSMAKEW